MGNSQETCKGLKKSFDTRLLSLSKKVVELVEKGY